MFTRQIGLLRHVPPQPTPLLRHVHLADPATATCSPDRSGYCDMSAPSRPRYCDMFTRQIGLLRHVPPQPTPLLRHVHPTDRATATCPHPADPATATCSPDRSGYCDMSAPSRPRYCDMFTRQIGLLRHVPPQPTPLLRHVHLADPATATCSPRRSRYCDMFTRADWASATCSRPADPATATCSPGRSGYCDMFAPSRPRYCDMSLPGRLVWNGVSGQRRSAVTGGNLQLDFSTSPPRRGKHGGQFPSEQVGGRHRASRPRSSRRSSRC